MDHPAVSVVLPTYNRAAWLPDAVNSVQMQTCPEWELIIVDDGSTDGTAAVVDSLARQDPRIRIVNNTAAPGPAGARNSGIRAANGGLVAFLDSDDIWEPRKLTRFLERFEAVPQAVLVTSDCRMLDRDNTSSQTMKSFLLDTMVPWWQSDALARKVTRCDEISRDIQTLVEPGLFPALTIAGFPWIQTSSAMVLRKAALDVGLFDEKLLRTEDIDLWLRLEAKGRFVYIDEVLATYDITGRDGGVGSRYSSYCPSRRHSGYIEARYHLRLLDRIGRICSLTSEQSELLRSRRIHHHRRCASIALRERHWAGLLHAIPCIRYPHARRELVREILGFLATPNKAANLPGRNQRR